ncbi:hypothetical protein C4588_06150 [Candidatus Parcubacteria bacterium]|jgi:hypothetical protein|nr:MAG: hypothetical protein C4588_06150 [Candidatus Parcubacteria bacterium]
MEEIKKMLEAMARKMADEEIKNYPVHVVIDGELVDADICDTTGGEIYIEIKTPLYFSELKKHGRVVVDEVAV